MNGQLTDTLVCRLIIIILNNINISIKITYLRLVFSPSYELGLPAKYFMLIQHKKMVLEFHKP